MSPRRRLCFTLRGKSNRICTVVAAALQAAYHSRPSNLPSSDRLRRASSSPYSVRPLAWRSFASVLHGLLLCLSSTCYNAFVSLAPFGLLDDFDAVLAIDVTKMYADEYRNWEELAARRLFAAHGIQVDRIAASMHQFVEKMRDPEVSDWINGLIDERSLYDLSR